MKTTVFLAVWLAASMGSAGVAAQTRCPSGVQAGGAQCLPDDEAAAPPRPTGEWVKTWGCHGELQCRARRLDLFGQDDRGSRSPGRAGKVPCHRRARLRGGHGLFQPVRGRAGANGGKAGSIDTGKDESVASQRAVESCEKKAGSKCSVLFVECSRPLFVKY